MDYTTAIRFYALNEDFELASRFILDLGFEWMARSSAVSKDPAPMVTTDNAIHRWVYSLYVYVYRCCISSNHDARGP